MEEEEEEAEEEEEKRELDKRRPLITNWKKKKDTLWHCLLLFKVRRQKQQQKQKEERERGEIFPIEEVCANETRRRIQFSRNFRRVAKKTKVIPAAANALLRIFNIFMPLLA